MWVDSRSKPRLCSSGLGLLTAGLILEDHATKIVCRAAAAATTATTAAAATTTTTTTTSSTTAAASTDAATATATATAASAKGAPKKRDVSRQGAEQASF